MNSVSVVFAQKRLDFGSKPYVNVLEGIDIRFENLTSSSNRVSDNNNIMSVVTYYSRNKAYVDGHQLSLNEYDIHSLTLELFSDVVVIPDISNSIHNIGFFLPHCVKTLNLKVEYVFQLEAYVNTQYLHISSQEV